MASPYEAAQASLREQPARWLVTGVAGFIGSSILQTLLELDQEVIGLDNFATGSRTNLDDVAAQVSPAAWARFRFIEGSITDPAICQAACDGVAYVSHQAALGSVPRSIKDPVASHVANVDGFLTMLVAARDAGVKRFVYASSSSVYGDHPSLPKVEENVGEVLSPYALTKAIDEAYARVFFRSYQFRSVGLRYFNVFGRRQSPDGPYAAVIPLWVQRMLQGEVCTINGDGETSRDFCYVDNAVQANIMGALASDEAIGADVFNVAYGRRTTLLELHGHLQARLIALRPELLPVAPAFAPFRPGDVRHSLAAIDKAQATLGYEPAFDVERGLDAAVAWYVSQAC